MTMRRGKLSWQNESLNAICDVCHTPRNRGDHRSCSSARKKIKSLEVLAEVKSELMRLMQHNQ